MGGVEQGLNGFFVEYGLSARSLFFFLFEHVVFDSELKGFSDMYDRCSMQSFRRV